MTVEVYSPDKLDQLALQIFDIAYMLRSISLDARKEGIDEVTIHDRKALEWCQNLEVWAKRNRSNFNIAAAEQKNKLNR